jgi:CTP synthase
VSGINPRRNLVEIVELKDHPWFLAVQFHPEFQSKPKRPIRFSRPSSERR